MNYPKVSIITPTYNRGDLIENTIESVLNQSYENIEYIVVDGLSTDKTINILESYEKKGKLTYISRKDKGMYYAINDGIKMANGDIIAYLNSDDLYFPWTVQRAVEAFQGNDSLDMVYGDSMVLDLVNNKKYLNIYASHKKYWLVTGGILCQPTVFLKKKVFNRVGYFNTEYNYLADCDFWLRVNSNWNLNIEKIDEIMAVECNHDSTFRQKLSAEIDEEKNKMLHEYADEELSKTCLLTFLKFKNMLNKEIKTWKFIVINFAGNKTVSVAWNNYMEEYKVRFNLLNYFMSKVSDRAKFPRFSIVKRYK